MELIDFSKHVDDFSLEDMIRDDEDASYTKQIIYTLDDLIKSLAVSKSTDFTEVEFKPEHMKKALEAVRDTMPAIWERMHPANQWEMM